VTNHYQCQDERWLILSLLNEDRQWPTLAKCLGREDLIDDPRFAQQEGPPCQFASTGEDL
jgi:formyl-CoA transferase